MEMQTFPSGKTGHQRKPQMERKGNQGEVEVTIGMPKVRDELQLGGRHGVVLRESHAELKHPALVNGILWALQIDVPVEEVRIIGYFGGKTFDRI